MAVVWPLACAVRHAVACSGAARNPQPNHNAAPTRRRSTSFSPATDQTRFKQASGSIGASIEKAVSKTIGLRAWPKQVAALNARLDNFEYSE